MMLGWSHREEKDWKKDAQGAQGKEKEGQSYREG